MDKDKHIEKNKYIERIEDYKYSLLAMSITIILWIITFALRGRLFGGKHIFMHSDLVYQMMPMIKMFLRQLFVDHNILYSFEVSLGSSTIPIYAFYACFSPFNLLALVPVGIDTQAFLIVVGKVSFAAFCFNEMSKKVFKVNNTYSCIMSVSYSMCSFFLAYYFVVIWQDGYYLLPIIVALIFDLVNKKKVYSLILAYAALFIFNFYTGYIVGIFSFLIFLAILFTKENYLFKDKFKIVIRYFVYVLIAVLLSLIVLLPTAMKLLSMGATYDNNFNIIGINILDIVKQMYFGQAILDGEMGNVPYIYAGIFPIVLLPLFFSLKKINIKFKLSIIILYIFLLICSLTKYGYIFIHAFNAPDGLGYRFAYFYSFILLSISLAMYKYLGEIKKKTVIITILIEILFLIFYSIIQTKIGTVNSYSNVMVIVLNIITICVYGLSLFYKQKKWFLFVSIIIMVELVVNAYVMKNVIDDDTMAEESHYYYYMYENEQKIVDLINEKKEYTRIYIPETNDGNYSSLLNYRSIGMFNSIENNVLKDALYKMGYVSYHLTHMNKGYTAVSGAILGFDYTGYMPASINNYFEPYIEENEALPIAYMISDDALDIEYNDNVFENLNMIISSFAGIDSDCYYDTKECINTYGLNIKEYDDYVNGLNAHWYELIDRDKIGELIFFDDSNETKYAYFVMDRSASYDNSPLLLSEITNPIRHINNSYITAPHVVEMGVEGDESKVLVYLDKGTVYKHYYMDALFYGFDDERFNDAYKILKDNSMLVDVMKDGNVTGKVISNENYNILFTSIPYEDGWEIYIDGEKTDKISLLNGAFLGAKIPFGQHEIDIKYRDKWFERGSILSGLGFLFLCLVVCIDRKKDIDEKRVIS